MFNTLNDEEWRVARMERLGLKEDPFKLSADPRYLYLGPEHLAVYRQAQGVVSRRRGLALFSGDMGMGKRSLARRIYDLYAAEDSVVISYIHTASFKLGGQREMNSLFETNKAVNARVFVRLALPPLTLSSSLQMVLFRLNVAGRSEPFIDDDAFELLYERSQGVPREIIRLCALATDLVLQSDVSTITIDIVREVVAYET